MKILNLFIVAYRSLNKNKVRSLLTMLGIIIGVAFNKIVSSLVNDIILPLFSLLIGNVNFQNLNIVLHKEITDKEKKLM